MDPLQLDWAWVRIENGERDVAHLTGIAFDGFGGIDAQAEGRCAVAGVCSEAEGRANGASDGLVEVDVVDEAVVEGRWGLRGGKKGEGRVRDGGGASV